MSKSVYDKSKKANNFRLVWISNFSVKNIQDGVKEWALSTAQNGRKINEISKQHLTNGSVMEEQGHRQNCCWDNTRTFFCWETPLYAMENYIYTYNDHKSLKLEHRSYIKFRYQYRFTLVTMLHRRKQTSRLPGELLDGSGREFYVWSSGFSAGTNQQAASCVGESYRIVSWLDPSSKSTSQPETCGLEFEPTTLFLW